MKTHEEIIDEVHSMILQEWSDEDQNHFFMCEWSDSRLSGYHNSLGRWIRNKYDLWSIPYEPEIRNGVDYSPYHPDAVSMTVIKQVWSKGLNTLKTKENT